MVQRAIRLRKDGGPRKVDAPQAELRFELKNTRPVDLLDLTGALAAFGEAYQEHVVQAGFDSEPGNVRLYVSELRTGSIIATLVSQAEQASFVLKHQEAAIGFLTHFNEIVQFFSRASEAVKGSRADKERGRIGDAGF